MVWVCMADNATDLSVIIDDVTADRSSTMNSEVCRVILSDRIQPNATKPIWLHLRVQMDKTPKRTEKATQDILKAK